MNLRTMMKAGKTMRGMAGVILALGVLSVAGKAQSKVPRVTVDSVPLPSAPQPQKVQLGDARATVLPLPKTGAQAAVDVQTASAASAPSQAAQTALRLTRLQAEQLALKNNPRVSVGRLLALAQHQVYREVRSAELPTFTGAITAVDANEGSRISAGTLTASRLFIHAGAGVTLSQLLTDFGRTVNLVGYSKLLEKAQNANALATTEDIVLATDQAFYSALQAQALLKVAQQTVQTRESVEHQVNELAKSKLKSTLDLSFAEVNLSQAKLLELDAQNNVNSTIAALTAVLGFDKQTSYELVEERTQLPAPPPEVDVLVNSALQQRPDLQASAFNQQAAEKFRHAQRAQLFPTISALGVAGGAPVRPDCFGGCFPNYFISSWYGAIGVNMSIPIFNGFLYSAQASEAKYRAQAAAENTRDLRDRVVRDVRTAWLAANTAFQRVGVAEELAKQADLSLNLAQERYKLGLGSIVELSQAQLQQADAAIGYVNAQYQYQLSLSTLNFEAGVQP
jgi:outer membrane protein